jgi:hypothetical protein
VAALALAACSPAPVPSPSFTPPPEPVDVVAWTDLVWAAASLPSSPIDVESEAIVAVDAGTAGFVAVGYHETEGIRDGAIWFSADGSDWSQVGEATVLADVELLDVVAASDGFVALGIASGGALGDRFQTVFLRSDDGVAWERVPATAGSLDTFPSALAAGPAGVLAVGDAADGGPAVWFSPDGASFDRVAIGGPAADGVMDPRAGQTGFVALGGDVLVPTILRSGDGVTWTSTTIDTGPDLTADHLVVGRWGYVVQGEFASGCGPSAACGSQPVAWWSGDGLTWGRLPADGTPTSTGASIVVPAGERGLVAIDGASAWSSADGWRWTPLPEPGDGSIAVNDAVVERGVIVAVGQADREDGSSVGRIIVGEQGAQ